MPPVTSVPSGKSDASSAARSRELAARQYNEKTFRYAQELAQRLGPPYGTSEVNWPQIIELWETHDPDLDIDQVWDDAAKQATQLIEKDKTVDPEKVKAEIPIEVARRWFPKREEAIKALGGSTYAEWAKNADEIEKRASKLRPPSPPAAPEQAPLTDAPDMASPEMVLDPSQVSGPEPVPTDPADLMAPAGPTGESPSALPGVGATNPLLSRAPGAL